MTEEYIVEYTDDLVDELPFDMLKDFLYSYNKYVQEFYEYHDWGSQPVCMVEYFNNDFQLDND